MHERYKWFAKQLQAYSPRPFFGHLKLSLFWMRAPHTEKKAVLCSWSCFQNFFFFFFKYGQAIQELRSYLKSKWIWCPSTLANLSLRASEDECTWNMWLLLEVGIASTSEHWEPELLMRMLYFCAVLTSVDKRLLALIWTWTGTVWADIIQISLHKIS